MSFLDIADITKCLPCIVALDGAKLSSEAGARALTDEFLRQVDRGKV